MNDWGIGSYLLLGIFLYSFLLHGRLVEFLHRRKIRRLVSFDRIARLADVGEKDLVFWIKSTSTIWRGAVNAKTTEFTVTFLYAAPMSLKAGERSFPEHHVLCEAVFDGFTDCSKLEEKIANSIIAVKQQYAASSVP